VRKGENNDNVRPPQLGVALEIGPFVGQDGILRADWKSALGQELSLPDLCHVF